MPGAPGRVVTLEHSPGTRCWGVAYLLAGTYEEQQKALKARRHASCSLADQTRHVHAATTVTCYVP